MYASYIKRFFSNLIDLVLTSTLQSTATCFISFFVDNLYLAQFLSYTITIIWIVFDLPFLQSSHWQASIGQKLLGIRTVDIKGHTLSFGRACYRGSLHIFCFWGFFMYFFSPQKQCLHDFLCDSIVVDKKQFKLNLYRPLRPIKYSIIIIAALVYIIPLLLLAKGAFLN